ncbi:YciI family protein [Variovorax sp. J22G21]|uniref:YciI family protein n=1 Tax=Variovorax fucosicus TaxID=3053517 RepID=UPI0025784C76|nr:MULTISPECIES: YciI family protein [unclassified Variovorax]MDM0042692.1 YciI family protein [Variovorax sp. J22R193]MDM0064730.1 YciI family protein [Variovorax sp. J22G21]
MVAHDERAQELLRAMLNKPLYVALRKPGNLARTPELLEAHLRWMIAAERRGELFASGPFTDDASPPGALGGMTIVRATSASHARDILSSDPFVKEGVVTLDVRKWLLMEGGFSVTVRLSDQSAHLF